METSSAQQLPSKENFSFTSAHCFIDYEEVQVEDEDTEAFDGLFGMLDGDYCQSYQDCLEELNQFTWKMEKRRYLDNHLEEILNQLTNDITIHQGLGVPGGKG